MKTFATIEEFKAFSKVTYYTVRFEKDDDEYEVVTEADKFILKFIDDDQYSGELAYLKEVVEIIGKRKGAKPHFFRHEGSADALPPRRVQLGELNLDEVKISLRWYCVRLSESVVVLLNGGVKDQDRAQDSQDVAAKFKMANIIAKAIDEKIRLKELGLFEKYLDGDFMLEL